MKKAGKNILRKLRVAEEKSVEAEPIEKSKKSYKRKLTTAVVDEVPEASADETADEGYDAMSVLKALKMLESQYANEEKKSKVKKDTNGKVKVSKLKNAEKQVEEEAEDEGFTELVVPLNDDEPIKKLTKQQKRDLKRNATSSSHENSAPEVEPLSSQNPVNAAQSAAGGTAKLTKQQKRDLKRNASAAALAAADNGEERVIATNLIDTSALHISKEEGSSVYKRTPIFPTPLPHLKTAKRFLLPGDEHYKKALSTCYYNFKVDNPDVFAETFHKRFEKSLDGLDRNGVYQYDITQPLGLNTKLAKTMVTRCLVGVSGITYKYLGIRMFSYSWEPGAPGSSPEFVELGRLNTELAAKSSEHLKDLSKNLKTLNAGEDVVTGSCQYNLILINKCEPENAVGSQFKEEPMFRNEKCSVSWHADSTLEHYSSIAVYQCSKEDVATRTVALESKGMNKSANQNLWKIAMRVKNNCEGPFASKLKSATTQAESDASTSQCPALAFPLVNGQTYYMLDEFNHHHQHCVLPGKDLRYSSTHRVCRVDGHTFQSIRARCLSALQISGQDAKSIRSLILASSEVEFEWIRQFYIQGTIHYNSHVWWHAPIAELIGLWVKLQDRISLIVLALQDAALLPKDDKEVESNAAFASLSKKQLAKRRARAAAMNADCYDAAIELLNDVLNKRIGWRAREKDSMYTKQPAAVRPITPVPFPRLARPLEQVEAWMLAESSSKLATAAVAEADAEGAKKKKYVGKGKQKKATSVAEGGIPAEEALSLESSFLDPADERETKVLSKLLELVTDWKEKYVVKISADPVTSQQIIKQDGKLFLSSTLPLSAAGNIEGAVGDASTPVVSSFPIRKKAKFIVVGK